MNGTRSGLPKDTGVTWPRLTRSYSETCRLREGMLLVSTYEQKFLRLIHGHSFLWWPSVQVVNFVDYITALIVLVSSEFFSDNTTFRPTPSLFRLDMREMVLKVKK